MTHINEFIEKYKADNFDSYLKDYATIEYWQNLIVTYELDKLNFQSYPEVLIIPFSLELKENNNALGVHFDGYCKKQIKILEIKNQYKPKEVPVSVSEYEHQGYFKGNAFEIWQEMYKRFKIEKSTKESVDLDFMYAVMSKKGLIHETVGLNDMRDWVSRVYEMDLSKLRYTDINQKANNKRMSIYQSITE